MKITWLGHACFRLESGGYSAVLDPYEPDRVPGYGRMFAKADAVLCSHGHGDHNYLPAVELEQSGGRPFEVKTLASFHDEAGGALRGGNLIHIVSDGETKAVHLGDLGHQLSPEQAREIGRPDVLMIPVGGFYTIDAAGAAAVIEELSPRVVIPMHYRLGPLGYDVLGTLDDFLALCDKASVRRYAGNELELGPQTEKQTAVLSFIKPRA